MHSPVAVAQPQRLETYDLLAKRNAGLQYSTDVVEIERAS